MAGSSPAMTRIELIPRSRPGGLHLLQKVGPEGEKALSDGILNLVDEFNTADDGSMRVPSEYAEAVMVKAWLRLKTARSSARLQSP